MPKLGEKIGPYLIEKPLGRGSIGEVFLATQQGRPFAIKFLNLEVEGNASKWLHREAQWLSQLSHPNLVKILDYYEPERSSHPSPFFVMELLEGQSLSECRPSSTDLEKIFFQTCLALHFLHSKGVLHRDLKPSNLFLTLDGRVKVLDFSLSIQREEGLVPSQAAGTYPFMAPETYSGHYSECSDLFALGASFYHIASGRLPYSKPLFGDSLTSLPPPTALLELCPGLPDYFSNLISQLLEKDPDRRPSSAWTVLKYLALHSETAQRILYNPISGIQPEMLPLLGRQREKSLVEKFLGQSPKGLHALVLRGPTGVGRSRFLEELRWNYLLKGWQVVAIDPEDAEDLESYLSSALGKTLSTAGEAAALELAKLLTGPEKNQLWILFRDLDQWSHAGLAKLGWLIKVFHQKDISLFLGLEINQDLAELATLLPFTEQYLAETLELELSDLSTEECEALIAEMDLLDHFSKEERRELALSSGGRPLLALESAQARLRGEARYSGASLPKTLQQALFAKVKKLFPHEKACLALFLVAQLPITKETLNKLCEGAEECLASLVRLGLLSISENSSDTLRLRHPSLKPLLLSLIGVEECRTAHRQWQKYAERELSEFPEDKPSLLAAARHALELEDSAALETWGFPALFVLEAQKDFSTALEWSGRLLKLSSQKIDPCALYAFQAPIFYRLARYSESLEAYRLWFSLRKDDESRLQKVKYHYFRGLVYSTAQENVSAAAELKACLGASDPEKFPAVRGYQARALQLLSLLASLQEEWELARDNLDKAKALGQGDDTLTAQLLLRQGEIALNTLRLSEAGQCLEAARRAFDKIKDSSGAMLVENNMAILERERGGLGKALLHIDAAIQAAKEMGERGAWARYLSNRGLILSELGRLNEAREAIRQSKEFLYLFASEQEIGTSEMQEAETLYYSGDLEGFQEACKRFLSKRKILEKYGLWNFALLLRAKASIWLGGDPPAEDLLANLESSPTLSPLQRWSVAILRLQWIHWNRPLQASDLRLLPNIPEAGTTPKGEGDWRALLDFLSQAPALHLQMAYHNLLEELRRQENPFLRLQQLHHLEIYFLRNKLNRFASQIRELKESQWTGLLGSLPEEIRMDYKKNMNLIDAEQAMKEPLSQARPPTEASKASPTPVPTPPHHEAQPSQSEAKFRQFCEISNQLAHKSDLKEILEGTMDAAILLSGAERGFLILKNENETGGAIPGYEIRVARHLNPKSLQSKDFEFSWSVVKRTLEEGAPVLTQNALEEEEFRDMTSVHALRLRSILALPLENQGRMLGIIYLDNRYKAGSFQSADLPILLGFANQAGSAILRQQMLEELQKLKSQLEAKVLDQEQRIEVLSEELSQSRDNLKYEYREIIGSSPAMIKVFKMLDHVSKTKIPIWIFGESGTGKELIARSLHENSPRKKMPYISENCGSIPETLLESELFGHKKGSFTHAERDRIGLFEQANGGTLFLDEVADMSLGMQVKLLRVLQEEEVRPIGSNKKVPIDVRLVTASNRDLASLVEKGGFREDLFYRINGMTIHLPPLRERREDIPALVHHLMRRIAKTYQLSDCKINQEALDFLMKQEWPGNIRQLEGVIRNAMMFADGKVISGKALKANSLLQTKRTVSVLSFHSTNLEPPSKNISESQESDKRQLLECLRRHNLDKTLVAKELGITPKTVYMRLAKFGIPKKNSLLMKYLSEMGGE
ncbi:MAG: sigma 54-interacting transcriptional regulator [Deltaproteobacteria bacterium]|nr:sigma 54-interacting transcriptional regulator [Deltaproteobacteria bacterium]